MRIRFGARMQGLVAVTPIDRDHTRIFARGFVELPVLGKLAAALGLWAELALVQPDDQLMLRSSSTREPTCTPTSCPRGPRDRPLARAVRARLR